MGELCCFHMTLACHLPHCWFDNDIVVTAQSRQDACGSSEASNKKLITLLFWPQRQITENSPLGPHATWWRAHSVIAAQGFNHKTTSSIRREARQSSKLVWKAPLLYHHYCTTSTSTSMSKLLQNQKTCTRKCMSMMAASLT